MNANELADLLDFDAKTLNWKLFHDAATMLRQQQVEIKSLRKSLDVSLIIINELEEGLESSINLNKVQAERNNEK